VKVGTLRRYSNTRTSHSFERSPYTFQISYMYTFDWVVKSRVVPSGKPRVEEVGVLLLKFNLLYPSKSSWGAETDRVVVKSGVTLFE
jgi:hypothetical protein